jgi:hypothetical protein
MIKKKFRTLDIIIKNLISDFGSGSHVSSLKDSQVDIDLVREYQPGDKKLDSKASLRSSRTMSRVFVPDKMITIFLVLDVSASQFSKIETAIMACLYLTHLADMAGDRVGLLSFSDVVKDFVYPNADVSSVLSPLGKIYEGELTGRTNLSKVITKLASIELENSYIFLISDFCYDIDHKELSLLKKVASKANNSLVALATINKNEWLIDKQPFSVDFMDSEVGTMTALNMSEEKNNYHNWQQDLKIKLRQSRVEPLLINVNESNPLMPLVKYFLRRQ